MIELEMIELIIVIEIVKLNIVEYEIDYSYRIDVIHKCYDIYYVIW